MSKAKFITFEGVDGAGKSTHLEWFANTLRERGIDLLNTAYIVIDLTPQGRGDWYASLHYGTQVERDR